MFIIHKSTLVLIKKQMKEEKVIMESKSNHEEQNRVSILQGDRSCLSRILARESSVGQSSRIFYRAAEGVPFKWETQPGTPKNPQEDDIIPPVCPSPLMQSIGLPLPNIEDDDPKETDLKMWKIWNLRKIMKKHVSFDVSKTVEMLVRRSKRQESSSFGDFNKEFVDSVKDSSFSSNSSSFSSRIDGPFCCSPWNVPAILDEGNTKIYYCSQHKTAFAVEEDGSFPSRILSRASTGDQFSGEISPAVIPFEWEMQPGTPKRPPENELVPPPSPPPAVQSLALPRPRLHDDGENTKNSTWKRAWIWIRSMKKTKEDVKIRREISFRYRENIKEVDDSYSESVASVSSLLSISLLSKGSWRVSKIRRSLKGSYFSCGPWIKRDILVFARRK